MRRFLLAILILPAVWCLPVAAAKYQWRDVGGVVHQSENPPPPTGTKGAPAGPVAIIAGDKRTIPFVLQPPEWLTKDPKGAVAVALANETLLRAAKGDAGAQNNIGIFLLWGYGTEADREEAAYWLTKAAEQGSATAATLLGSIYSGVAGGEPDYAAARKWFELAAGKGDGPAQEVLSRMYFNGLGVEQSYAKSLYWLQEAKKNGARGTETLVGLLQRIVDLEEKASVERRLKNWVVAGKDELEFQKSTWDGSVQSVKDHLSATLHDPYTVKYVEWGEIMTNGAIYRIGVRYRAKNAFNAYRLASQWFYLTRRGDILYTEEIE